MQNLTIYNNNTQSLVSDKDGPLVWGFLIAIIFLCCLYFICFTPNAKEQEERFNWGVNNARNKNELKELSRI